MTPEAPARRRLVSYAAPHALAPMTRVMLGRLGYEILGPDRFAHEADEYERPDCVLADERSLAELADDGGPPLPVIVLTGAQGVTGADPRIAGAIRRPAGLHELYRLLQAVLEETPRTTPRVPTHLPARCRRGDARGDAEWKVTLLSLSENGCLMRSPEPVRLGATLELGFELPGRGRLELLGEVAYQLLPDVGMVFSGAPARMRESLAAYVTEALARL